MATQQQTKPVAPAQVKPATPAQAKPADAKKEKAPLKSRRERFEELAPKRTRTILRALETLSNCSNRSGYEYQPEEIEKIRIAIQKKLDAVIGKFTAAKKEKETDFSL